MPRTHYLGALVLTGLVWLLVAAPAPAQDADLQRQINAAIDKGVEYLRKLQNEQGAWGPAQGEIGPTILAAWTLLESGVSPDDPVIVKAAKVVRENMVRDTKVYHVSLGIIFLDKLGDSQDIPMIESLAVRLLAGQNTFGGWTYFGPDVEEGEGNYLATLVKNRRQAPPKKPEGQKSQPGQRTIHQTTQQTRALLTTLARRDPNLQDTSVGDNSNTQFAMIALWVARRYGMPVDRALALTAARFRQAQDKTKGYWEYIPPVPGQPHVQGTVTPSMSCAGLLGLALEHAVNSAYSKTPPPPILGTPAVKAGLKVLANVIDKGYQEIHAPGSPSEGDRSYYFLWSLERVGVVYGLTEIEGKNWYVWGARDLVKKQGADGSWVGAFAENGVDTCFGLLFLKRANVAEDLTEALKGKKPADVVKTSPKDNVNVPLTTFIPKIDPKKPESGRLPGIDDPKPNPKKLEEQKIEDKKKNPKRIDCGFLLPTNPRLELLAPLMRRSEPAWVNHSGYRSQMV